MVRGAFLHLPGIGPVRAARLRALLEGSDVAGARRTAPARVQDAYSLRCMPQVHGAVRGALRFATSSVEIETGSATDNPLVFAGSGAEPEAAPAAPIRIPRDRTG